MTGALLGKRILVVEDEYFIAADLKRVLTEQGAEVVGPAGDVERSMALADQRIDAALLDINLEGSPVYGVADALSRREVPIMFLTGYDSWAIPEPYRSMPRLTKPYRIDKVIDRIEQMVAPC